METNAVYNALFGLAIGDALGVPVEFLSREKLKENPVKGMREYGTHNQPLGTWSDDSSLSFCLADSLCKGYNLEEIAHYFSLWLYGDFWTPHGRVFDIGIATREAIEKITKGESPAVSGGFEEKDNGNGSLMRILPLAFHLAKENHTEAIFQKVKEVSSITHAHFRSVFACFIYTIYALELVKKRDKWEAYDQTKTIVLDFIKDKAFNKNEIVLFDRVLQNNINELSEEEIFSSGYVLHTLEAGLWCILTSDSYSESVLKAVNLGSDTDTTATVTGGLAGIIYGFNQIPKDWIACLARKDAISDLCNKLSKKYEIH